MMKMIFTSIFILYESSIGVRSMLVKVFMSKNITPSGFLHICISDYNHIIPSGLKPERLT